MNTKILTTDNWLKPDPTSAVLYKMEKGIPSPMTGEDWVTVFSGPQMSKNVPENIRELFEVARGAMAYGYFFYPLATLASEQLFRVAETAITEKCRAIGAPDSKTKHFVNKIQYLFDEGLISNDDFEIWTGFRKMRNSASHPERQTKYSIGMIVPILRSLTEVTNRLFD